MRKRNEYQDRVAVDSVMDLVVGWQQLEELKHTGGTSAGASLVPSGGPSVVRSGGSASGSRAPSSWQLTQSWRGCGVCCLEYALLHSL